MNKENMIHKKYGYADYHGQTGKANYKPTGKQNG